MSYAQLPLDRPTPVSQSVFQQSYGGSLACCQVMLVFYGLSILQTYLYFIRYEKDRIYLKLLVLVLFLLSTAHAALVCHTVWHYLVFSYTDVALLTDGEWSVYTSTAIGVVSSFLVQWQVSSYIRPLLALMMIDSFFGRMIFYLLKGRYKYIITGVMAVLVLAQLGFGITLSVKLFQIWQLYLIKEAVYIAMIPLFCVRMLADTVTASTLCVVLYDRTSDQFGSSIKLVKTLIMYAINRFVLTTVLVMVQTIILVIRPEEIWAMVLEFITVHIYVNSLLATLNAREHLRDIGKQPSTATTQGPPTQTTMVFRSPHRTGLSTVGDSTGITVTEQVHVDFGRQSFELSELDNKVATTPDRLV
ncbi:hypothetical protein C8Q80DRAFT_714387 [Daedaleopsis nitida]|nr:hypothetical protein C8Q80DRAFT_714387 [Daedaleopsis nitida]